MKKLKLFLTSIIFCYGFFSGVSATHFLTSFLRSYDFAGRFSHEYHTELLTRTRESFVYLENKLYTSGFKPGGHVVILGYQEEGIPPYYSLSSRSYIDDEAVVKTAQGFTTPAQNIFGFLTGFLLKDAQWIQEGVKKSTFVHTPARTIDLFNDHAVVLQKHAFKDTFDTLIATRNSIEKALVHDNPKHVFDCLITYWNYLYSKGLNNKFYNTFATQDILFSIDYAQALLQTQAPIKKVFIGPDITYPIELSNCQSQETTHNAQTFVKIAHDYLQPCDGKKTAYIFCSFVDGVGKSTLLNNIKNYSNYGTQYKKYTRCDNSSSQYAHIYEFSDNVLIVDLPAQVSHFTVKPHGKVYANWQTVPHMSQKKYLDILQYLSKQHTILINQAEQIYTSIHNGAQQAIQTPESCFLETALLFTTSLEWIPFEYAGAHYIFAKKNYKDLRVLISLEEAHSTGLKVIDPCMMLFDEGLSLPKHPDAFTEDLVKQLHNAGVETIVFVDFMSMYPRTSRETVRVNFILQYLRLLFGDRYKLNASLYQNFIHREQEIYQLLQTKKEEVAEDLILESVLRYALFQLIQQEASTTIISKSPEELRSVLQEKCTIILKDYTTILEQEIATRINEELVFRHDRYALDRIYHTTTLLSLPLVKIFSDYLTYLFATKVQHSYFKAMWTGLSGTLAAAGKVPYSKNIERRLLLDTQVPVTCLATIPNRCQDITTLTGLTAHIRAQWYALLANILYFELIGNEFFKPVGLENCVPPLVLKPDTEGNFLLLQRWLPIGRQFTIQPQVPMKYHLVDMLGTKKWGVYAGIPHCLEWDNVGTYFGIFAYGYHPYLDEKNTVTHVVELYNHEKIASHEGTLVMPTSELYKRLTECNLWELVYKETRQRPNTTYHMISEHDGRREAIKLWVRTIATLEMILKDTHAHIVVRHNNKDDFIAALYLLEHITLPLYYNIILDKPLFEDYTSVEPVIHL